MSGSWLRNEGAGAFRTAEPSRLPLAFHRRLPGYRATPLVAAPLVADSLGIAEVWVKDESDRLGLPSFKALGASWAVYRALEARMGDVPEWDTLDNLAESAATLGPLTLAAATDGNHGRAVARMAHVLGFGARIFVPARTAAARIEMIRAEGAEVTVVNGTYDDAVRRSAEEANERCLVISDTAWPGYEDVPRWVIEGYSTIFWEIEDDLDARSHSGFDLVAVQIGVGALAAAAVRHFRREGLTRVSRILAVEPVASACAFASMRAGGIITFAGEQDSIMAGLNCATPSPVAWPLVSRGVDVFVTIDDARAEDAMRALAASGIESGESGAAGLAGLAETLKGELANEVRPILEAAPDTKALVLSTEGATDPGAYARIIGAGEEAGDSVSSL